IPTMVQDVNPMEAARRRVDALRRGLETGGDGPVRLVETHISWVLLTPALAFKLKKPVHLPFVDFTTLAARRRFSAEELRLNRRLAPSLYLDVVDVCEGSSGARFGGGGRIVDAAVRMRRFADGALWTERQRSGSLHGADIDALAARLAAFHRDAPVAAAADRFGAPLLQEQVTNRLIAAIEAMQAEPEARSPALDWPCLRDWLRSQGRELDVHFEARRRAGHVRECHGDLHLANIVQLEDGPAAFDGIEFDPALRWIDVVDDVAFLAMDLIAHGAPAHAHRFLDGWLAATGDYDGLPALRFYMVRRALVRACVAVLRRQVGAAEPASCRFEDYLELAARLASAADPRLAVTCGLPGSGKSFVSGRLVEAVGAIRVRSDVERKRLFGLGARQSSAGRVPGGIYDAAATGRTYARLLDVARLGLESGWPVIVDAAFLRRAERTAFQELAASMRVPFSIIDCQAPMDMMAQRLDDRQASGADPSEADRGVLQRLSAACEPLDPSERAMTILVEATRPADPARLGHQWLAQRDPPGSVLSDPPPVTEPGLQPVAGKGFTPEGAGHCGAWLPRR
ncbi:MAG: AAA family ATPase, partial [Caldimonas sp.]